MTCRSACVGPVDGSGGTGSEIDRQNVCSQEMVFDPDSPVVQAFLLVISSEEILGFPRHLSQHVGGFVIADDGPLSDTRPGRERGDARSNR